MKKVIEWLEELPEPYRSEAVRNCKKDKYYTGDQEAENISEAIGKAFVWDDVFEGHKYWSELHDKLMPNEP